MHFRYLNSHQQILKLCFSFKAPKNMEMISEENVVKMLAHSRNTFNKLIATVQLKTGENNCTVYTFSIYTKCKNLFDSFGLKLAFHIRSFLRNILNLFFPKLLNINDSVLDFVWDILNCFLYFMRNQNSAQVINSFSCLNLFLI